MKFASLHSPIHSVEVHTSQGRRLQEQESTFDSSYLFDVCVSQLVLFGLRSEMYKFKVKQAGTEEEAANF